MTPTEQEMYYLTGRVIEIEKALTNANLMQIKADLKTLTETLADINKKLMQYNALDIGVKGFKIDLKTLQDKLVMVDSNFDKRIAKLEVKPVEPKKKRWFEI